AVELEHEAQYAVGGGMLRPEIDGEIAERRLIHPGFLHAVGPAVAVLRQVRRNRQVRRRVSSAQVWLIGYALLHPAPLDFPSRRRGFSARTSIWRTRSRETPNSLVSSWSVIGSSESRRAWKMRRSRSLSTESAEASALRRVSNSSLAASVVS